MHAGLSQVNALGYIKCGLKLGRQIQTTRLTQGSISRSCQLTQLELSEDEDEVEESSASVTAFTR